jgi:MFS family permease
VAPDAPFLIAARAVQGIGAALLTPGSLAIIEASFTPADRGKAIGAWSGLSGVGSAIGPFLGGWLIQAVSWRLIFLINLPIAALVVAVGLRHIPESRDPGAIGKVDVTGGVLVTGGLVGLTYGLIQAPGASSLRFPAEARPGRSLRPSRHLWPGSPLVFNVSSPGPARKKPTAHSGRHHAVRRRGESGRCLSTLTQAVQGRTPSVLPLRSARRGSRLSPGCLPR